MKILVTGFTPFGGEQINPSWEAVERLPDRIGEAVLLKREIPTEFDAACAALRAQLDELRPDAVLSVGQYGGANCIRVERVAVNLRDARIADNAGAKPVDAPVVCNNLLYCALHESAQKFPATRCGFVHVPYLPEQAKDGSAPSMSLALMTKALEIAAEVIVEA